MKIGLIQFSVVAGNIEANLKRIEDGVIEALECGEVALCGLPELCTTGFNWEANARIVEKASSTRRRLAEIARRHGVALCGSFLEANDRGRPVNRFLFFEANGEVAGQYDKAHRFSAFREDRNIDGGNRIEVMETSLGRVGPAICYDLRFPEVFRKLALQGASVHILPAAFPKPRLAHWRTLIQARAIENHAFVLGINQCGFEGAEGTTEGTEYFGHSMAVSPAGDILAECGEGAETAIAELDMSEVAASRKVYDSIRDRRGELYG